jgi:Na+/melibiose symporter-like transporter
VLCGIGSIIGIVLGVVSLNQIKQTQEAGHGLAIAGIAVGAFTLLLSLVWTIALIGS